MNATDLIPTEWWKVIALLFGAVALYILKWGITTFLDVVKNWLKKMLDRETEDMNETKEIVKDMVSVQQGHELRIQHLEKEQGEQQKDIRELRLQPHVTYKK